MLPRAARTPLQSADVLSLAAPTDPSWTARALADLDEVLVDHAHAEKKAASTAVGLLFRYPERAELQAPLARLAREELRHFERVLAQLVRRGVALRRQEPSPYAARLHAAVRPGEPERLVDTLLCCALIEARSCERFGLLAGAVGDAELAALWRGLLSSEARHHRSYLDLACAVAPPEEVRARLRELAAHEARVIAEAPPWPRLHT
jgi:tRNA-(ms[2]io[6]A)-hydroxylase